MVSDLNKITESLTPQLKQLNDKIMLTLSSGNDTMNQIVEEYLRRKGKQIRPIMVILSASLFISAVTDRVISTAAAVEMLHNASLIHDDVVDQSEMRRNEPTINGIWDNHIAVLVGDYFTSSALQLATDTGDIRIISSLASLGRKLAMGELDQINNARFHRLSEEAYMSTIERKTASLFMHCAEMGAYAAGAPTGSPQVKALAEFARLLGMVFQITDDIFDYFPQNDELGKPTGNDLREGKVTLPLLSVLLRPEVEGCSQMKALLQRDILSPQQISSLIAFAIDNGGIDYARHTNLRLAHRATEILCSAFPNSPVRANLLALLDHTLHRSK